MKPILEYLYNRKGSIKSNLWYVVYLTEDGWEKIKNRGFEIYYGIYLEEFALLQKKDLKKFKDTLKSPEYLYEIYKVNGSKEHIIYILSFEQTSFFRTFDGWEVINWDDI